MQQIFDAISDGAHTEAAAAIAAYSFDINVKKASVNGMWSCLSWAVLHNSIPAIEALATRGDVSCEVDKVPDPATLRAVLRCFSAVDLNACFPLFLSTPVPLLTHAASYGCMECVQLLLDAGADPMPGAAYEASLRGYETIAELIERHAAWANGLGCAWTRAIVGIGVLRL